MPDADRGRKQGGMDDAHLVEAALDGSKPALDELFERCWPVMWRAALAVTGSSEAADDIAQDAVVAMLRSLERFDRTSPLEPWARRIAANRAIDAVRARAASDRASARWAEAARRSGEAQESAVQDTIIAAVQSLAEPRRVAVVLHYWLDYSIDDIAARLGTPRGTVMSRLARARADLRATLGRSDVERPRA